MIDFLRKHKVTAEICILVWRRLQARRPPPRRAAKGIGRKRRIREVVLRCYQTAPYSCCWGILRHLFSPPVRTEWARGQTNSIAQVAALRIVGPCIAHGNRFNDFGVAYYHLHSVDSGFSRMEYTVCTGDKKQPERRTIGRDQ